MKFIRIALAFGVCLTALTGCFTGVESTPKITAKELKKQHVVETPEKSFLEDIAPAPPAAWHQGKTFYIADNRASRAAWRIEPPSLADSLAGEIAVLARVDTVPTLTERPEIGLTFTLPARDAVLEFRTGLTPEQWRGAPSYTLPHLIDMEFVDKVAARMKGKQYYILPSRRNGHDGNDTTGTRYQPVTVLDVLPATEATPLRVVFSDNENHLASVLMTTGNTPTSRRNFDTLFSFDDPRRRYRNITDENWELICHGKVQSGMTPEECRLALGSPDNYTRIPTTAGMVERWTYVNGVYLVFEEGLLSAYRQ